MLQQFRPALFLLIALTLITGVIYPLATTGLAQFVFPAQANGSLIRANGKVVGSALIGQQFDDPRYFWSRPSATTPNPYNAASSSGSNLGPLHPDLRKLMTERQRRLRAVDPANTSPIPIDLLTASASGLDPHISPEAAQFQASRIARLRGLPVDRVNDLVHRFTESPQIGLLGEPRVNVVRLNLSLDTLH